MSGLTSEEIQVQAQVFLSPDIHHASLLLVRESVFTMVKGLMAKIWLAPAGENITTISCEHVEVNKTLADALLNSWEPSPVELFGEEGWQLLQRPIKAFSEFLEGGQPVLGDEDRLMYCLVKAEQVQMALRDCHRVLERAIKQRDPKDHSPLDKSMQKLGYS